jgi:hypothetical protein
MWLLSVLVLAVVGYVVSGRELPVEVVDQLSKIVPEDFAPSEKYLALSFIAGLLVAGTPLHNIVRYLSTVTHELGHAFMAGALGGRPKTITISLNSNGLAVYQPPLNWGRIRASLVSVAGYPAPALAAVAAVKASQSGHPKAWFAFAAGTLAVGIIFLIRNFWGFLWTSAVVTGSYFGARELNVELIGWLVGAVAGYLAMQGYRDAWTQLTLIRKAPGIGVDAEKVAFWWKMNAKFTGFVHLMVVTGLSGYATYLAINPYWTESVGWLSDALKT